MNTCYPLPKENRVVSCVLKGYSSAPCMPPVVNWSQCTVYTVASGQRRIRKSCSSSLIRDACKSDFHSVQICFIAIRKWFHLYNFFGQLAFNYNGLRFHYFYFTPKAAHELYNMSWSWSYGSSIYIYLCNQYLSPLTLWVRIPHRRCVLGTTLWWRLSQTCCRSVVFSGYSGFLHQ
jgi:hypothetical protein